MRTKPTCTQEQFLKDVAEHNMTIVLDKDIHRHMVFQKPRTLNCMFGLVTWPGHLYIYGDMGDYSFSRIADMFQFFRAEKHHDPKKDGTLYINLPYWSEKLQAVDKNSKVKEYSYDILKQVIQERIDEAETTKAQRDAVEHLVASLDGEPMVIVQERVRDFETFEFPDFWEHDLTEFTYHFIWCCYAIAWGIQQYDAVQPVPAPVEQETT